MASRNQREQLRKAQVQNFKAAEQSPNVEYAGRDAISGLSLIRTQEGALIPARLEGSAQPFEGESLFGIQTEGLAYAIGRSIEAPAPVFINALAAEPSLKIAILFKKSTQIPRILGYTWQNDGKTWTGTVNGRPISSSPGLSTTVNILVPTSGSAINLSASLDVTDFYVGMSDTVTLSLDDSFGLPNALIASEAAGVTYTGNATYTFSLALSDFGQAFQGDVTSFSAVTGSLVENFPANPGGTSGSVGFSHSLSFTPGLGQSAGHSAFISGGVSDADNPGMQDLVGNFTRDITISGTAPAFDPEVWVGGDRASSILLAEVQLIDSEEPQEPNLNLAYISADADNLYVFTRDNIGGVVFGTFPNGSYHEVDQDSIVNSQTIANPPGTVTPNANDWKQSLATFTVPEPPDSNPCFQDNRSNSFANIQDSTRYTVNIFQDIDGTSLADRLIAGESVENVEVEITPLTVGVTCSEGLMSTVTANIDAIVSPSEQADITILGAAAYVG